MNNTLTLDPVDSKECGFEFEAIDVTGTITLRARGMKPSTPAGTAAHALASRMQLPNNVPWMLRSDDTGAFLTEEGAIGDQIETGDRVVVTPKTHLG